MLHENSKTIYLKDYLPPEYLIDQVDLHFDLGEAETRVRAQLTMRRNPKSLGGRRVATPRRRTAGTALVAPQ